MEIFTKNGRAMPSQKSEGFYFFLKMQMRTTKSFVFSSLDLGLKSTTLVILNMIMMIPTTLESE